MMNFELLRMMVGLLPALALASLVYALGCVPIAAAPTLGYRGSERRVALESGTFRFFEPLLRLVASWFGDLTSFKPLEPAIQRLRQRTATKLEETGDYLGLTPDEFIALSILSSPLMAGGTALVCYLIGKSMSWVLVGALFGALLPGIQLAETRKQRFKEMSRSLPIAIDLASMCMGAGLDFPGALRLISQSGRKGEIVPAEFGRILASLDVGHTRKHALRELERRFPIESVRDFVRALIQAEEKGNPIAEALRVQATVGRLRRSIAAEEAASRAGVLMIIPMLFLLCCILILLMGPFAVRGIGL
jgi:tight adherence protein C